MRVTGLYAGRLEGVNIFSKEEEREKALSAKFPVGSEIEVYVNSKNPSKTNIFNQDSGVRIFALSLCILCSALITISPIGLLAI